MSSYAIPLVDDIVDGVVGAAEDNALYRLPKIGGLLKTAVGLCLDAAAYFTVALTFGGGLYYFWPSVVGLLPHWLGTLSGYWSYVLVVLGLCFVRATYKTVMMMATADVLRSDKRDEALKSLSVPGMLILLAWLITTFIS